MVTPNKVKAMETSLVTLHSDGSTTWLSVPHVPFLVYQWRQYAEPYFIGAFKIKVSLNSRWRTNDKVPEMECHQGKRKFPDFSLSWLLSLDLNGYIFVWFPGLCSMITISADMLPEKSSNSNPCWKNFCVLGLALRKLGSNYSAAICKLRLQHQVIALRMKK